MSVASVQAAIKKFLASPEPEVLCIRGNWGTGKTYNWQNIAKAQRGVQGGVALNEYAYVSLFGLNSIGEVKIQILQNTVVRSQIGELTNFSTLINAASTLERGTKKTIMQSMSGILGSRAETLIAAMGMLTHKQIICIDDFERKGAKLSNGDVLGFISYLKEERKCKVVLLLNDMQLDDRKSFDAYLEKVVDVYLKFDPSAEEIADIAVPETDANALLVRSSAIKLGINNVRVIRKILWLVREVVPMLEKYHPIVTQRAISTITLFGWSYLAQETAPSLDYLTKVNVYASLLKDNDSNLQWRDMLLEYEFTEASDFDLTLLKGVQNGYFDQAKIDVHATELDQANVRQTAQNALREVWNELFGSFKTPAGDILTRFFDVYSANAANIGVGDMIQLEKLFRELNDPRSEGIIDSYVEAYKDNPNAFETDDLGRFGEPLTARIVKKFGDAAAKQQPDVSPEAILLNLVGNGFQDEAVQMAATLPVEEYLRVFQNAEGMQLSDILNAVRQYIKVLNPPHAAETIMNKAGIALQAIEKESEVNRLRARRYGLIQRIERIAEEDEAREQAAAEAAKS